MSSSTSSKKQCVICNKSGGIMICYGCQQSFCGKHVNEHRQELGGQLENIMQEQDIFQQELEETSMSKENPLLKEINQWEKESITKIQVAAESARKTVQELLKQSKARISKLCDGITKTLRSAREADDFSENDLIQWQKQLKDLQLEITSPSSTKLIQEKNDPVYLLKVEINNEICHQPVSSKVYLSRKIASKSDLQEQSFYQILGPISTEADGYVAKHVGQSSELAYFRGRQLCSEGCNFIRFKIEQTSQPYCIFFGCMSSQTPLKEGAYKSLASVGWFGFNQVYEHGLCTTNCQKYGYHSSTIQANDELHLIIDCDKEQVRLYHKRKKTTCVLSVNRERAPFPWQYLIVLGNPGDSVRILLNA